MVIYDPVVKESRYFSIFECGKYILSNIDVTHEQSCMSTPREKYYTKMCESLVDYNDYNGIPLSNEKI